jgi:hypothetical protein
LPDPDHPFLISPLPQFTTPLTTSNNFSFTPVPPLPELTDDLEDEDDEAADSEPEHEATPTVVQQDLRDSNGLRRLSFQTDRRSEHDTALARTGPYLDHRRARSGSSPEMYTSPSSVSASADASNASPRSPPKSATLSQSQQVQHASSSREGDASFSTRTPLARNTDGGVLRTRLHDILRDSAISSSLPNMSASHFPPSLTNRETSSGRASPLPPRSDSSTSNTNKTPLLSSSSSDTAPQTGAGKPLTGVAPNFNFAPRQGFSSASTEAKKLEEERKRKMKEESSRLEKSANDMDRESHMSKQPSSSTSTQTSNNTSSQLTPRREQPSITTTTMVSNSGPTSFTRRGHSFTGRSGSSIVSPTGSKEEHDTFTHQARYVSNIGKARGILSSVDPAGIYA